MRTILSLLAFLFCLPPIWADEAEPADIDTRYLRLHSDYTVNDDLTHSERHEWAVKILKQRALERSKKTTISYSASIQQAEVLEAYTLKPDGRRIDAPKTNYQVRTNKGRKDDAPVFSDRTYLSVVFPEVQVGDTVVFAYRLTQSEPLFPDQFSINGTYPSQYAYDEVRVRLDVPAGLKANYRARQMDEQISENGGRKRFEWHYANPVPKKNERRNYSVWDMEGEPGFAYSTFDNYRQIAEAYGVRALPKAAATPAVHKLADEITAGTEEPREQARLLYEWVATNITYAGNCIGVGAVVPHDLNFILDNRMGDCKDHATLLHALLAAKGIEATQALINSGNIYTLPEIPMVNSVNHVINYLPGFDLYLDATDPNMPFGMLGFAIADKPVLLVENYRAGARTPVAPLGSNQQHMRTLIHIQPDGSAKGEIEVELKGSFAVKTRAWMRNMSRDQEQELLENAFRSEGHLGKASMDKDDPSALLDHYHYQVEFEKKDFIQRPDAGAFNIFPPFPTQAAVHAFAYSAVQPVEGVKVACSSGHTVEDYTFVLPEGMHILAKPKDMQVEGGHLSYSASYKVEGNRLRVHRVYDDRTPGNICNTDLLQAQREVGLKVMQNLKSQVVYQ